MSICLWRDAKQWKKCFTIKYMLVRIFKILIWSKFARFFSSLKQKCILAPAYLQVILLQLSQTLMFSFEFALYNIYSRLWSCAEKLYLCSIIMYFYDSLICFHLLNVCKTMRDANVNNSHFYRAHISFLLTQQKKPRLKTWSFAMLKWAEC